MAEQTEDMGRRRGDGRLTKANDDGVEWMTMVLRSVGNGDSMALGCGVRLPMLRRCSGLQLG